MTRCPKCNSLLIVCGTGAVCSRDMACGRVTTSFDRAAIDAEWTKIRNDAVIARLPTAILSEDSHGGLGSQYVISDKPGRWRVAKTVSTHEELRKIASKPPTDTAILAASKVKDRVWVDWYELVKESET